MSSWWVLSVEQSVALVGIPVLGGVLGRSIAWLLLRRDTSRKKGKLFRHHALAVAIALKGAYRAVTAMREALAATRRSRGK
jgi:hypothetical protein